MSDSSIQKRIERLEYENYLLSENALECIWLYDLASSRMAYLSPSVTKLLGISKEEALDRTLKEILTPESLKRANKVTESLIASLSRQEVPDAATHSGDYQIYGRGGTIVDAEVVVKIIENRQTGAPEILGIARDITARKQLENQLTSEIESKGKVIERLRSSERSLLLIAEELNRKNRLLQDIAIRDALTQAYNRYYFDERVGEETDRRRRHRYPLSIALIDIDDFKSINDSFGHDVGDEVLVKISTTIQNLLRKYDIFARWGGEEFAILMPHTDLAAGEKIIQKLRRAVEDIHYNEPGLRTTASFGVIEFMQGETRESWFKRVDYALFQSKDAGKNRVTSLAWPDSIPFIQMKLDWRAEWESGNAAIDDQHKKLVILGNGVTDAMMRDRKSPETAQAIERLMNHVVFHFEQEEQVLSSVGYPDTKAHQDIHQQLVKSMYELRQELEAGNLKVGRFFSFLFDDVIVGHLLEEDTKFFPYVGESQQVKKEVSNPQHRRASPEAERV